MIEARRGRQDFPSTLRQPTTLNYQPSTSLSSPPVYPQRRIPLDAVPPWPGFLVHRILARQTIAHFKENAAFGVLFDRGPKKN
jgi:hypothetical protein